jgi:hypothetical protein
MDYKINRIVQNGSTTVVHLRYYVGAITTEDEYDPQEGEDVAVTRYRRTGHASVSGTESLTKHGDVELSAFVEDLNDLLATKAAASGHTPIAEQTNE